MITVNFTLNYHTEWGQNLFVCGSIPQLGNWDTGSALLMEYLSDGNWVGTLLLEDLPQEPIQYKYYLKDDRNGIEIEEWGKLRLLEINRIKMTSVICYDFWRPGGIPENALYASAFTKCLWSRNKASKAKKSAKSANIRFRLNAPRIDEDHAFCITGSDKALGEWDPARAIVMDDTSYPSWKADVVLGWNEKAIHYKYGIYNRKSKKLVSWEAGDNRILEASQNGNIFRIVSDEHYRYPQGYWRGIGVAIPVFSLRTRNSFGTGEFLDIKVLIDWAVKTGIKLVQILPVNDTIVSHQWTDSYPYAAISVFALHPMYMNLPAMGRLKSDKEMDQFIEEGLKLNGHPDVDYEPMIKLKSRFYKRLYDETRDEVLSDPDFNVFFEENKEWLIPYAAFSCLRDRYKTVEFGEWPAYSVYNKEEIDDLTSPDNPDYDDYAVHYFIQYHLHKQLKEVTEYAREKGVVLKGDLPIGIFRHSTDAWVAPHLYHMDKQAGAPPDAYAVAGQNWRFPTYDWGEMAKDDYRWWRKRLGSMGQFFDAYRIDHILGFFRIWEIPMDQVEGLMGRFNPAIPMFLHEFEQRGLYFDYERYCNPYIRDYMVDEIFGNLSQEVKSKYLIETGNGFYKIKEEFNTQKKVENHFAINREDKKSDMEWKERMKSGLFTLIGNVIFFEEPGSAGTAFHPKIAFHQTHSYKELDDYTKNILNDIYTHYFYHRQENFWREQAMVKLPAITRASDMLVCGEDLGMVPQCVPGVMAELGVLRLEIQRMPKGSDEEFGHPGNAPYLSVVSPSCHDMSTVRGWWEEDTDRTQRYYNHILGHQGSAPPTCEPWISEEILVQHMYSPAMWAIFPIQDIVAIEPGLRRENPDEERINIPANPNHYWRYRFHMNIEDLLENHEFNKKISDLINMSGRNKNY